MKKSKLEKFKEAIKNPPPDRLASIEYKSHLLQGIGILIVCTFLIIKGYWYVIFALIFGVGVSYSQGITAYQKYKVIKSLTAPEKPKDYMKDISYTRRRSKVVDYVFGSKAKWISIILAVILTVLIVSPTYSRWLLMFFYPVTILVCYFFLYFFVFYLIAKPIYDIKMKGGNKKDAKKKEERS